MEIYLLRHGSAEPVKPGASDSERALTEEGRYEVQRVIAAAKLAHTCPSLIVSSPYRRAMETARIAADLLDYQGQFLTSNALTPEGAARAVWEEVRLHSDQECLLLSGHEPLFSAAAAYLLGCPELRIDFPKAGLLRADVEGFGTEPRAVLRWLIAPSLTV